jgi:hypothetical protein
MRAQAGEAWADQVYQAEACRVVVFQAVVLVAC